MTGHRLAGLSLLAEGDETRDIIAHLLLDRAMKLGIVVVALLALGLGMMILLRNTDKRR